MNWKKALLIATLGLFALVFFTVAAAGLVATAALGAAAVAISESDVVQAFEEVAANADRLQIELEDSAITFTDPDSGKSRTVTSESFNGSGRLDLSPTEITITGPQGESRVIVPGLQTLDDVTLPQITITDPDSGQSRVIRPDAERFEDSPRAPRVVWDGDYDYSHEYGYGPGFGLSIVGGIFRGLFNLTALVLIAAGVVLLFRNRRRTQDKLQDIDKTA